MKKYRNGAALLAALCILCSSCEKEVIVEVAPTFSWSQDDAFLYQQKALFNLTATNEALYALSAGFFSEVGVGEGDVVHTILPFPYPYQNRMPVTDKVFVGAAEKVFAIFSVRNPVLNNSELRIRMDERIPGFARFNLPPYNFGDGVAIFDDRFVVAPFQVFASDEENPVISGQQHLLLTEFEIDFDGVFDRIDSVGTMVVSLPMTAGPVLSLEPMEEYCFVACANETFRLQRDGSLEKVLNGAITNVINVEGAYYGFGFERIYSSLDNGSIWTDLGAIDIAFNQLQFSNVADKWIGFYNSQLFEIDVTETELVVKELDNDGLDGHRIMDVAAFQDEVYIATLSGMFTRPLDSFFEEKQ